MKSEGGCAGDKHGWEMIYTACQELPLVTMTWLAYRADPDAVGAATAAASHAPHAAQRPVPRERAHRCDCSASRPLQPRRQQEQRDDRHRRAEEMHSQQRFAGVKRRRSRNIRSRRAG
jgi:hypothetical protein